MFLPNFYTDRALAMFTICVNRFVPAAEGLLDPTALACLRSAQLVAGRVTITGRGAHIIFRTRASKA